MNTKTAWVVVIIAAFASVISFFQINSAWADKHHFNTGWLVIGIVAGIVAIISLIKVVKDWGSSSRQ